MTVAHELARARQIFSAYGDLLRKDGEVEILLRRYEGAIRNTQLRMEQEGIGRCCVACAQRHPGGCCFAGVEEWYDAVLLLINLLLGAKVPSSRAIDESCFFVGPQGCRLVARHAFCVNYFCPETKERLIGSRGIELLEAIGKELNCGWQVEGAIGQRLRRVG